MILRATAILLLIIFSLTPKVILANENVEKFNSWKNFLTKELFKKGYEKDFVAEISQVIEYSQKYKQEDKKQFEPQTFAQYYKNAVNNRRIKKAKRKTKENLKILNKIAADFGVPKEYVVSLWAIETDMGRFLGKFNVLNSLANLSFDKRRRELFLNEFFVAVEIYKNSHFKNVKEFQGSWAGAIGQCQFLPSTYKNHAFDYNKNGQINIWNEKEDVLASIANYLQNIGWNNKLPWGYEIKNIKNLEKSLNFKNKYNLKDLLNEHKIVRKDGLKFNKIELSATSKLVRQENRLFVTFKNFDLIKEWNRSTHFALTVGLLAQKI